MINPSKPYNIKPTLSKALFHPKYLLTWSGLLILFLLSKLPFKLTLLMGKILGLLLYLFAKKRRKIAEINLQLCFPKKNKTAIQNLTKKTFVNIGKGIFEMAIAWWASDLKIKKIKTSFQKKNILLEAANNNEGVLVLIKHSTHLEMDLRIISQELKLGGMYKPQTNLVVNFFMIKARNSYFTGTVDNSEAVKAIRWMKNGLHFLYAADQDYGKNVSSFVKFFDIDAATVEFPGFISEQGIKTIFLNVDRNDSEYRVEIIELGNFLEPNDFLKKMNLEYEKAIKNYPDQYLWVHRRFKSSKSQSIKIYPEKV